MSKLQFKNETLKLIDVMIENADKGPSGFWTEDYEGCGNPKIFPEFKEGLQHGKLIQKNHYLCPWNTAIMYGDGHGNIGTGCYHSCSIKDSKYLTAEMLKAVLLRFRKRLASGSLDKTEHISPLLTPDEISYIKEAKITEQKEAEKKRDIEYAKRKKKAAPLLEKYPNMEGYIVCNYEENIIAMTEGGDVNFNPQSLIDLVGGEKLTYIIVFCSFECKLCNSFRICERRSASRFDNGSSKSKSEGLLTKALPIATRCFWPPEILSTFFPKMSSICNTFDIDVTFSFITSFFSCLFIKGKAILLYTFIFGYKA